MMCLYPFSEQWKGDTIKEQQITGTLSQSNRVMSLAFLKGIGWITPLCKMRTSGQDTYQYRKKKLPVISAGFLKPRGMPTKHQHSVFHNAPRPEAHWKFYQFLLNIDLPYRRHSHQVHTSNLSTIYPPICHSSKLMYLPEDSFTHTSSKISRSLSCVSAYWQAPP